MIRLLIATKNQHKAAELSALLAPLGQALNLADWEAQGRKLTEPEETGATFEENARLKSKAYAQMTGLVTLADDSGLMVAALGGRPGIFSARYGGPGLTDEARCALLLKEMEPHRDRRACFVSALALSRPDGASLIWSGQAQGLITTAPRGENGFGYDPVFYHQPSRKTFAQLTGEEKNQVSHRAEASRRFMRDVPRVRRFIMAG